jgi:hypothetical protein
MKKNLVCCVLSLALFFGLQTSLHAQKQGDFTIQPRSGHVELVPDGKLNVPDAADLSPADLKAALEGGCKASDDPNKFPTFCIAWTGAGCTGTGTAIPCGFALTGTFASLSTGCTTSYGRLASDGLLYRFVGFPDNTCITPNGTFFTQVACTTP